MVKISRTRTLADKLVEIVNQKVGAELLNLVGTKVRLIQQVTPYTVGVLVSDYEKGRIVVDPDMRREYSWNIDKASRFIESVYKNLVVTPILLVERPDGRLQLIDGFHRLETLRRFVSGELVLKGVGPDLNGKSFKKLTSEQQLKFMNATIPVIITTLSKEDPSLTSEDIERITNLIIYEQFRRVNLGVTPLTTYQVIFCGLQVPAVKMIKEASAAFANLFKPMRDSEIRTMKDKQLVLALAVCLYRNKLLNLSATGKIRLAPTIANFLFLEDVEALKKIKERLIYLAKLAEKLGYGRDMFVPKTFGFAATQTKLSTVLFLTQMWLLHELDRKYGEAKLVAKKDKILDVVKSYFSKTDALKPTLLKIVRHGSQSALDALYVELRTSVEKILV